MDIDHASFGRGGYFVYPFYDTSEDGFVRNYERPLIRIAIRNTEENEEAQDFMTRLVRTLSIRDAEDETKATDPDPALAAWHTPIYMTPKELDGMRREVYLRHGPVVPPDAAYHPAEKSFVVFNHLPESSTMIHDVQLAIKNLATLYAATDEELLFGYKPKVDFDWLTDEAIEATRKKAAPNIRSLALVEDAKVKRVPLARYDADKKVWSFVPISRPPQKRRARAVASSLEAPSKLDPSSKRRRQTETAGSDTEPE